MEQQFQKENFRLGPMFAVMLIGAFVGLLNEMLLATALPAIMDAFAVDENRVQWLITAFLLTNGVMIPISAFLIERFTTRSLFLTAYSIFGLGTLLAALAPTFPVLLAARIVQAAGSGIMLPLMMTVVLTVFPKEKRGMAMGFAGIVISFGPAIGPTLSGWLLEHFSWRGLFYVVLPIVIITIGIAIFTVKNVTRLTYPKIDVLSILMSSFGFGGLLYGVSRGGEGGGDWTHPVVLTTLIGGAVILILFIWRQLVLETPLLQFRILKFPTFSLSLVITMIVLVSLIGPEMILPLYMQNLRGFTALESGLMLLPGAIIMGIMSPITGMLFDKFGARWLAVPGLVIVTVTTFVFTNLSMEISFSFLTTIYAIRMFGLSLAMMPIMTAGLNKIPEKWNAHGSAMANTMQQVSASIGTAVLITIMTANTTNYVPDASSLEGLSQSGAQQYIMENASLHGFNTAFMFAAILALIAAVLTLFIKSDEDDEAAEEEREAVVNAN